MATIPHKTQTTAVVIIPPRDAWGPIQSLREQYDRQVRRWMPHITLLYPFRPVDQFPELRPHFERICADLEPFSLRLHKVHHFRHGRTRWTLWLDPIPHEPLRELVRRLQLAVPDCTDTGQFPSGFTPHLSIGQSEGTKAFFALQAHLRATWTPLSFPVDRVALIHRGEPPDDVFRVACECRLGEGMPGRDRGCG